MKNTEILSEIDALEILYDEPLSRHTGFQTGGPAHVMVLPKNRRALKQVLCALHENRIDTYLLGNGTNVLAPDEGYDGCVVKTSNALNNLEIHSDGRIVCGAGVSLKLLCERCADAGLSGLEFAYGIPGTVGGAVFMNAGAYDGEMNDVIDSVEVLDCNAGNKMIPCADMRFGYRTSMVQQSDMVVLTAVLKLEKGVENDIWAKMNDLMQRRQDKQPLDLPSCGSTFKRPAGAYASKLIDDCGLCGYRLGGAAVSEKHCGFIVNRDHATSKDILDLIDYVKNTVKEKTGYELECEIRILSQ